MEEVAVLQFGHAQHGVNVLRASKTEIAQTQDAIELMESLLRLKTALALKIGSVVLGLNVHQMGLKQEAALIIINVAQLILNPKSSSHVITK